VSLRNLSAYRKKRDFDKTGDRPADVKVAPPTGAVRDPEA